MYILYGHAEIYLPYCSSLKEKRKTIQSIIMRIRKRYNISIVEVQHQNLWQRSLLGFSAICNTPSEAEQFINAITETLYQHEDTSEITAFTHDLYPYDLMAGL